LPFKSLPIFSSIIRFFLIKLNNLCNFSQYFIFFKVFIENVMEILYDTCTLWLKPRRKELYEIGFIYGN
jgi:hypothetical protein